jgi:hypothetical protein
VDIFFSNIISIYLSIYLYNIIYVQVLDIYVNYDCDLKQVDIFAKVLSHLTRIVQSGVRYA